MYNINEIVISKKPHACGGNEWTIIRVGADYKLKCNTCNRQLLVSLDKLEKIIKKKNS